MQRARLAGASPRVVPLLSMTSCAAFKRVARSTCARSIASASGLGIASRRIKRSSCVDSGQSTTRIRSTSSPKLVSTSSGTATSAYGAVELRELRARACADQRVQDRFEVPPFGRRRRRRASAAPGGSSSPDGGSTPGPNSAMTAAKPGSPSGHDLARDDVRVDRARRRASRTSRPRATCRSRCRRSGRRRDAGPTLRRPPCDHCCRARVPRAGAFAASTLAEKPRLVELHEAFAPQ